MLSRKVLVRNISNLSEARYCAGMGVNFIAFNLNKENKNSISLAQALEIKNWLAGVAIGIEGQSDEEVDGFDFLINKSSASSNADFFEANTSLLDKNHQIICETLEIALSWQSKGFENIYIDTNEKSMEEILNWPTDFGLVLYGSNEERPGFGGYDSLMDLLEALED